MHIKITDIKIKDGRRPVKASKVNELADSIMGVGLINPIVVTRDNELVAGAHRIEAYKLLGFDEIPATVMDLDGLEAELAEIDENLIRNELHFTERGDQLLRRKEIYEELHPETVAGKSQANGMNAAMGNDVSEDSAPTFTGDVASKTGMSKRTIEQEIQIAKTLEPEVKEVIKDADLTKTDALKLARMEATERKRVAEKLANGETTKLSDARREVKREEIVERLESVEAVEAKTVQGVYDVIVIDPPWPMQKIERDERPNQSEFDYPTMTELELSELEIPVADNCHVWLWTTHKFLPMAFRLLEKWGLKYVCQFVWHKPGGFQPIGLPQYNCEFALYARKGTPEFIDTKAFPTCFDAPRGAHSEKPESFYRTICRVTAGRRLDMFNRRKIQGFETWGKEAYEELEG